MKCLNPNCIFCKQHGGPADGVTGLEGTVERHVHVIGTCDAPERIATTTEHPGTADDLRDQLSIDLLERDIALRTLAHTAEAALPERAARERVVCKALCDARREVMSKFIENAL